MLFPNDFFSSVDFVRGEKPKDATIWFEHIQRIALKSACNKHAKIYQTIRSKYKKNASTNKTTQMRKTMATVCIMNERQNVKEKHKWKRKQWTTILKSTK